MRRRHALHTVTLLLGTLLSGCSLLGETDIPDIAVKNDTEATQTVTIEVTHTETQESVLAETLDLPSTERTTFDNPITESGTYQVDVAVQDGPSNSYQWDLPNNDEALQLSISITPDSIAFQRLAA